MTFITCNLKTIVFTVLCEKNMLFTYFFDELFIYLLLTYMDIHSLQTQTDRKKNYVEKYVHFNTASKQTPAMKHRSTLT